ncbi:spore cortex biosynthesis protein YabQ [Paenibacillus sp. GD4]|uniref:spore cortex biosynthesis protein YabQ n=1 Tax=Paenibacillus sp. GD4 TaxID=3068890 RepID=UPI002796596F|nr:spore cortex biosynthesis protein YabQ [Paenibacillus sp. GD4]MDQ1910937.1 spore cortex biosynthesis protein YabQ [Paenibacillus sp. GD4]
MTLDVQFLTLGSMFSGGLVLGTLYDLYRVLAGQLKVPLWLKAPLDLLYWMIGTVVVFYLLYESNQGEVRPFVFLAIGIGICFYFGLLSRIIIRIFLWLIRAVISTYRFILRMIDLLIVTPIVWLYRVFVIFLGFLSAMAIFLYKVVLQLLYPAWKLLLWLVRPLWRALRGIPVPAWMKRTGHAFSALWGWLFDRK